MSSARRISRRVLLTVLGLHLLGVGGLIGYGALLGDRPVVDYDLGMHFYRAALLRETSGFPGLIWDPAYMGGYRLGGATDIDNRLGELALVLLGMFPPGAAWNWTLFLLYSSVPVSVFLAARWSNAGTTEAVVAATIGVLLFWAMRRGDHAFVGWGMYGWVVMSAIVPLLVAALQRCLARPGIRTAVLLGITATLAAYAHGLSATYLVLLVLLLAGRFRTVGRRHVASIAGAAALATILVWPIALPVLQTLRDLPETNQLTVYFQATPREVLRTLGSPGRIFGHTLLLLSVVGLATRRFERNQVELAVLALLVTALSLAGSTLVPLSSLQPLRNLEPALFLTVVPVSVLLVDLLRRSQRCARWVFCTIAVLCLAPAAPVMLAWALSTTGLNSLSTAPSREAAELLDYLRDTTTPDRRILFEDDGDFFGGNHFGAPHLGGYIARELGREMIGGPHPVTLSRSGATNFVNGSLLDRPLDDYTDDELRDVFRTFNIGTIAVWSPLAKQTFRRVQLVESERPGGFSVFRTEDAEGFADGADEVTAVARPNLIRVTGATSSPTLLRWHHDPRFEIEPALPMRPVKHDYGPVGFVLVDNGDVAEFTLRFR